MEFEVIRAWKRLIVSLGRGAYKQLSACLVCHPFLDLYTAYSVVMEHKPANHTIDGVVLFSAGSLAAVFEFPVCEVFACPLIKKWIPNTLRKELGCLKLFSIIASLELLMSSTVWYMQSNKSMCMFTSEGFLVCSPR